MASLKNMIKREFSVVDVLGNGRTAFDISDFKKDGEKVDFFVNEECLQKMSLGFFKQEISRLGVEFVFHCSDYIGSDCRDWAFDWAGLPKYTWREGGRVANNLLNYDFFDICWTAKPEAGNIAMYFNGSEVEHWGVVSDVGDEVRTTSKWGVSHVLNYPLECVAGHHGDYVMFFDVKK